MDPAPFPPVSYAPIPDLPALPRNGTCDPSKSAPRFCDNDIDGEVCAA